MENLNPVRLTLGAGTRSAGFVLKPSVVATPTKRKAMLKIGAQGYRIVAPGQGGAESLPVFAVEGSEGPPYVATGRATLRLAPSVDPSELRLRLDGTGFRLEQRTRAGFVVAPDGGEVRDALARLDELAGIEGVTSVEPELVTVRAPRSSATI